MNKTDKGPHPHGAHVPAVTYRIMGRLHENMHTKHLSHGLAYYSAQSTVLITINKCMTELCLGDVSLPNSFKASTNQSQIFLSLETCKLNFLSEESTAFLRIGRK